GPDPDNQMAAIVSDAPGCGNACVSATLTACSFSADGAACRAPGATLRPCEVHRSLRSPSVMKRVQNPPNPWATHHVDWLGEPPQAELVVFEEQARSILTKNTSPDVPFAYSVNPYRGCYHGCAYCYARPTHQYLDFGA